MPAYFDTGFTVREPAWHGLGVVLDEWPQTWPEARVPAGLTWEPRIEPLYQRLIVPVGVAEDGTPIEQVEYREVPNRKLVVRDDTEDVLGAVSDQFSLVTHEDMGTIMEAVLGQPNAKFESAGSIKDGGTVWALVRLDEPYRVAGDTDVFGDQIAHYPYLALINSHDGTGSCKVLVTQVRIVCWNTVQAASMEGERTGRQFIFRHTGDVLSRIEEAKAALAGARDEVREWTELAERLFGYKVTEEGLMNFLHLFVPDPPAGVTSDRVKGNIERERQKLKAVYESVTVAPHHGTALGLVDAAVEYLDHLRGYRSKDTYFGRQMLRTEPLKAKAMKMAIEVAN